MSSHGKTFCDPCRFEKKGSTAKFYCQTCMEYYCRKCKKQHLKFRLTMGHHLINLKENWKNNDEKIKDGFDPVNSQIRYITEQKYTLIDQGVRTYKADVLETEASKRCNISGRCTLCVNKDAFTLTDIDSHVPVFWSFISIRRFGSMDDNTFFFECGRRCQSGEGRFVMLIHDAVNLHKTITHLTRVMEKGTTRSSVANKD
ncbi:docking protein 3-like [Mercenaria mercenaria]|uniref:docking protein 3-like n=1 Tax=Mercenaria mercenaria TaxID=6596 RepID=UPI00234EB457|nr:docking protein 3-like [Mercenaria mercenaria]